MASRASASGEVILKVVNVSGQAHEVQVELAGATKAASSGTAIVLTSASPADENSLAEPKKVAPAARPVDGLGPRFNCTFPAYSLTILRVKAEL
jgi:alpha-L-arabinofuranosidase